MKRMILIAIILTHALTATAIEKSIVLLSISSNFNPIKATLGLVLDENSDIVKVEDIAYNNGKKIKHVFYSVPTAIGGFVLHREKNRDIVTLVSPNLSAANGGNFKMNYLYNGVLGSWRSETFDLLRDGDDWAIYLNGRRVNSVELFANKKPIVGVVGIRSMKFE